MFRYVTQFSSNIRNSHQRCSIKNVSSKIQENSQENTCVRVSFLIKRHWHICFPMNFAKFLRTRCLQNTSRRLLKNGKHLFSQTYRWLLPQAHELGGGKGSHGRQSSVAPPLLPLKKKRLNFFGQKNGRNWNKNKSHIF